MWNTHSRSLHNHWAWDSYAWGCRRHSDTALDMYEHGFHMDYGTQAAKYVDAWFRNLDWEAADRRFAQATGAARS